MPSNGFSSALSAWKQLLADDQVIDDTASLTDAQKATFAYSAKVLAILHPEKDQLAECLSIARQHKQKLYTVSSGKNWGYGSQLPVSGDSVILNLGRLKKISNYDKKNGVVTVEAGVTQAELAAFLKQQGDHHWMDCTGSSASCSVVGNTVERGFGHTAYGEHVKYVCGLEVMLIDGRVIKTGLHRFGSAKAAGVYQPGLGPALDGLFFQSNLGVVLSITLWLMPKPENFLAFYISTEQDMLEDIVESLSKLKRQGYLTSLPHIANPFRVLPGLQQYPAEDAASSIYPLAPKKLKQLRNHWQVGVWNVSGALYGTKEQVKLAKSALKKQFRHFKATQLNFVSDSLLQAIEKYQWLLSKLLRRDMARVLAVLKPVHLMMKGQPSDSFLASAYWRMPELPENEYRLDQDGVGLIWCAVVAPAEGEHARRIEKTVTDTLASFDFEGGITFTLLSERCLDAVISISFNRHSTDNIDWDQKAIACRRQLYKSLLQDGYFPYRLDISMMQYLAEHSCPQYEQVLQELKHIFDANNLLSPGRYITHLKV